MKQSSLSAIIATGIVGAQATNNFKTVGTPEGGQFPTCTPSCKAYWKDSKGCNGDGDITGDCTMAFSSVGETDDTGVDICDGAGMFWCNTGHGKAIFVINTSDEVSVAYVPEPESCTFEGGQCAGCEAQDFCSEPKYIGNIGGDGHNCKALVHKLNNYKHQPPQC